MTISIDVLGDLPATAAHAAELFIDAIRRQPDGPIHVVLTGGSTGIAVLRAIGTRSSEIDWSLLHVWWGDERFVPAMDAERNDRQADEALLAHVPIEAANIHRVAAADGPLGDDPDAAAAAYADELARHAPPGESCPRFAVLMLGVGEEGHTASIFPQSPAATDPNVACAVRDCPKPPPTRVSLTFPTLSAADEVWLMTTGAGKASAVAAAINGADPLDIPAAGPRGKELTRWLLDESAASALPARG
ncbi:MAG: 6-phosphogluconolactonase [Cumulibacter sp.]